MPIFENNNHQPNTMFQLKHIILHWKAEHKKLGNIIWLSAKKRLKDRVNLEKNKIDGINAIVWYKKNKSIMEKLLKNRKTEREESLAIWHYYKMGLLLKTWGENLSDDYFFKNYYRAQKIQRLNEKYYGKDLGEIQNKNLINLLKDMIMRLLAPILNSISPPIKKFVKYYNTIKNESKCYYDVFINNDFQDGRTSDKNTPITLNLNHTTLMNTFSTFDLSTAEKMKIINPALLIENKLQHYLLMKNKNSVDYQVLLEKLDIFYWKLIKKSGEYNNPSTSIQLFIRSYLRYKYIILYHALTSISRNKIKYESIKLNLEKTYAALQAFDQNKCCNAHTFRKITNDVLLTLLKKELKSVSLYFKTSQMKKYNQLGFVKSKKCIESYLTYYYSSNFNQLDEGKFIKNLKNTTRNEIDELTMKFVAYKKLMDFKKNMHQCIDQLKMDCDEIESEKDKLSANTLLKSASKKMRDEFIMLKKLFSTYPEFYQILKELNKYFINKTTRAKTKILKKLREKKNDTDSLNGTLEDALFLAKAHSSSYSYCLAVCKFKKKLINEIAKLSNEISTDELKNHIARIVLKHDVELKNIYQLYRKAILATHTDRNNDKSSYIKTQLSELFNDVIEKKENLTNLIELTPITIKDGVEKKTSELVYLLYLRHYERRNFDIYNYILALCIKNIEQLLYQKKQIALYANSNIKWQKVISLMEKRMELIKDNTLPQEIFEKNDLILKNEIVALNNEIEKLDKKIYELKCKVNECNANNTLESPPAYSLSKLPSLFANSANPEPQCNPINQKLLNY